MADTRWFEVAKKEPNRWIDHPAPYEGHYAYQVCQLCMVEPVGTSEQEHEEAVEALKKDNEQLLGENQRLSEAAASATYWERRALRAEEILNAYAKQAGRAGGHASRPRWHASQMRGARWRATQSREGSSST